MTSSSSLGMRPGDIITYDFRKHHHHHQHQAPRFLSDATVKLAQWNIERGYQLDAIIERLKAVDADIVTLQELDVACERTQFVNVPEEIARALECQLVFFVEFVEHDSPERSVENRCGKDGQGRPALHGNAILSKRFSLLQPTVIPHSWGLDWDTFGHVVREPRTGFRGLLRCHVEDKSNCLAIYCLHLEIFHCGPLNRVRQIGDAIFDARCFRDRLATSNTRKNLHVYIGGDLNTIGQSIVRLSPLYHRDRMWLLSLGENETSWISRKMLQKVNGTGQFLERWIFNSDLWWRLVLGFSSDELQRWTQAGMHFYDPFHRYRDVTLNNPKYRGLVQGKLDWMLLSNLRTVHTDIFNHDYQASDHKGLVVHVQMLEISSASEFFRSDPPHFFGEFAPYLAVRVGFVLGLMWMASWLWSLKPPMTQSGTAA